jgi:two-component system, OmpR family, sensor kinase
MAPSGKRPLAFSPSRWPVRWRIAGVSAGLTFAILLVFAAGVGRLVENRLRADFRDELEAKANELALTAVRVDPLSGQPQVNLSALNKIAQGADGSIRLINSEGSELMVTDERPLPSPEPGTVSYGQLEVATSQVPTTATTAPAVFVQFARDHDGLDATIDRLWLFLGVGVGGGALLATLAGLWIAQRAMRPIAGLTATARKIATTRDPSLSMPEPQAEDEVAELARTLDSMLRELDAARTESQQMVQAQREFIADASHELRTPLTSILANLELLQERLEADGADGDEGEMVDSALRSSRRMRRLVADLLMLARADAGRVGERAACDLAEIAEAAVDEVRPVAVGHKLELATNGPVPISGNADELHRLTVNLLDNAVRHTPPGSTVEVSVERRDGQAVLVVADDGPGLPEGMEEQVFSRFVRGGGPADLAMDSGTGLGLAIVRAVAASHGGTVAASNDPERGARFEVTLPVSEAPVDAPSRLSANV